MALLINLSMLVFLMTERENAEAAGEESYWMLLVLINVTGVALNFIAILT